jgi:thiamine biosynthesis protein ThiI
MRTVTAFSHIVLHYDEIGLKANNRGYFEKLLIENVRSKLGESMQSAVRECGQIALTLAPDAEVEQVMDVLRRIPGIANLASALRVDSDLAVLEAAAVELAKTQTFQTFKIRTRRHDKGVPLRSMEVNRVLGAAVLAAMPEKTVRMDSPDLALRVEIAGRHSYLSMARQPGVGGLPTNSKQKVVALLSGGMDSPVAAYLMMKRGCEVILTHYQNQNQLTSSVEDKILRLAEQLARYQRRTRLFIIPFEELQKDIIKAVPGPLRMLVYRRVMLRLSSRIAAKNRARFLVVGDSLSQVASQTYENLSATYLDSDHPIVSPLIGLDKREITALSRQIETFDISALPYADCCSYFLPKHPELHASVGILREHENRIDLDGLGGDALENARLIEWT